MQRKLGYDGEMMNKAEYDKLLENLIKERDEALYKARQRTTDIDALKHVWSHILGNSPSPAPSNSVARRGDLAGAIRDIVQQMDCSFTMLGVEKRLRAINPQRLNGTTKSSISGKLSRMVDRGQLKLIRRGRGRKPSLFRKVAEAWQESEV